MGEDGVLAEYLPRKKGEKMKKTLTICILLLLSSSQVLAKNISTTSATALTTSPLTTWQMNVKPLDFAHSLDNKLVFVLGDDSKVHIYTAADGTELGSIPVARETVAIDIAPRGEKLFLVDGNKKYTAMDISFVHAIDTAGSPFLGKENAPVTLVVFSDFQCPYCGKVQSVLDDILEKNHGKVKLVFKNFPLRMHKNAKLAALAAMAAHEQGKFWQMHDALFAVAKQLTRKNIEDAARDIGLDMKKFNKDLSSPTIKKKLNKDIIDAINAGVGGTPTLFINGHRAKSWSVDNLQKMIDQELAPKN